MPNRVKNQAVKLYTPEETLFNDKTSRCEWHEDYFPQVACDDVSEVILNIPVFEENVGLDSGFDFAVDGTITGTTATTVTDATATFQTDGVQPGMWIMVYSSNVTTLRQQIVSVDSETQLTVGTTAGFGTNNYEISYWEMVGDVTIQSNEALFNSRNPNNTGVLEQVIEDNTFYKVQFTITNIISDAPASYIAIELGSGNRVLQVFAEDVEAKTYTVFGFSTGTEFSLILNGAPELTIDDITIDEMFETSFTVKDCSDDSTEYTGVEGDFLFSNTLDQLKMSIDWSNVTCNGCYYIDVEQKIPASGGPELINNGAFDSGANWTTGSFWTIGSGKASCAAVAVDAGNLAQTTLVSNLVAGLSYDVDFDVSGYADGSFNVKLYGSSVEVKDLGTFNANGSFSVDTLALDAAVDEIRFVPSAAPTTFSIDNVSIKQNDTAANYSYRSDCFNVSNDLDCMVKLSGTNLDNAFGIDFEGLNYNPFIRVAGELQKAKFGADKENEEDSDGVSTTLYFKSETIRELFLYQLPMFHHDFIRLLIGYDTLKIDDVEYISTNGSYEPIFERILGKMPDLGNSLTEVRLKDDLNENKFC